MIQINKRGISLPVRGDLRACVPSATSVRPGRYPGCLPMRYMPNKRAAMPATFVAVIGVP